MFRGFFRELISPNRPRRLRMGRAGSTRGRPLIADPRPPPPVVCQWADLTLLKVIHGCRSFYACRETGLRVRVLGGKPLQPNARYATVDLTPKGSFACLSWPRASLAILMIPASIRPSRGAFIVFLGLSGTYSATAPGWRGSCRHSNLPAQLTHQSPAQAAPRLPALRSGVLAFRHTPRNLQRLRQPQPGRRCPWSPGPCDGRTW